MTINELEQQLVENKLMTTYAQTALYEEAVNSIFNENNPAVIDSLIKGFHDETENQEVMYSTLHGIEFFYKKIGPKEYIAKVFPLLTTIQPEAYGWAETFFLRLLNNEQSFNDLKTLLPNMGNDEKKLLKTFCESLSKRNPERFAEKTDILLALA